MSPKRVAREVRVEVEGRTLKLSNLDKVLYPRTGTTKGEVLNYYAQVAPVLLPQLEGPRGDAGALAHGVGEAELLREERPDGTPSWVRTRRGADDRVARRGRGNGDVLVFPIVDDLATLTWLANLAALELHVHQWTVDQERQARRTPNRIVIDLDPGEPRRPARVLPRSRCWCATGWPSAASSAAPVTSGSKGLHLYAALPRRKLTPTRSTALRQGGRRGAAEGARHAGHGDDDQGASGRARCSSTGRRTPARRPRSRRTRCAAASCRRSRRRVTWDEVEDGRRGPAGARAVPLRGGAGAGRRPRRPVRGVGDVSYPSARWPRSAYCPGREVVLEVDSASDSGDLVRSTRRDPLGLELVRRGEDTLRPVLQRAHEAPPSRRPCTPRSALRGPWTSRPSCTSSPRGPRHLSPQPSPDPCLSGLRAG